MKIIHAVCLCVLLGVVVLGCRQSSPEPSGPSAAEKAKAEVAAALAKLDTADRQIAQAQRECPIAGELLGSMGTPVKIELNNQVVFLCCESCEGKARAVPEATLAKVKALVSAAAAK